MQVRLYIDEDAMAETLVKGLRARGIDVATTLEEEMTGSSDEAQIECALKQKRAIYTFNVGDFCRLHKEYLSKGMSHSGIIVVYRKRYGIGEQIRRLFRLVQTKSAEEMSNDLIFL